MLVARIKGKHAPYVVYRRELGVSPYGRAEDSCDRLFIPYGKV